MTQAQGQDRRSSPPPKVPLARRTFTLSLTPARLISSLAGIGILIAWSFVLGVLLGRGYAPEAHIPELDRLMPRTENAVAPAVIASDRSADADPAEDAAIIQPGDMGYRQTLKGSSPRTASPETAARPASQPLPSAPAAPPREAYVYIYQVAAYKAAAPCQALVDRLKKAGLNASTEKSVSSAGTTWYKTMIRFQGTPDDVSQLRRALEPFRLNTLILRSKNPMPAQRSRP
ncbi:MAG: SPOR domain-containing protein [Desulfovibrio sp.]|jgi:hypothetical protein|nr:SPOR domain-containing protein [Desulfovibrio sp.]